MSNTIVVWDYYQFDENEQVGDNTVELQSQEINIETITVMEVIKEGEEADLVWSDKDGKQHPFVQKLWPYNDDLRTRVEVDDNEVYYSTHTITEIIMGNALLETISSSRPEEEEEYEDGDFDCDGDN